MSSHQIGGPNRGRLFFAENVFKLNANRKDGKEELDTNGLMIALCNLYTNSEVSLIHPGIEEIASKQSAPVNLDTFKDCVRKTDTYLDQARNLIYIYCELRKIQVQLAYGFKNLSNGRCYSERLTVTDCAAIVSDVYDRFTWSGFRRKHGICHDGEINMDISALVYECGYMEP